MFKIETVIWNLLMIVTQTCMQNFNSIRETEAELSNNKKGLVGCFVKFICGPTLPFGTQYSGRF